MDDSPIDDALLRCRGQMQAFKRVLKEVLKSHPDGVTALRRARGYLAVTVSHAREFGEAPEAWLAGLQEGQEELAKWNAEMRDLKGEGTAG